MPLKQQTDHNLNEERTNVVRRSREISKSKISHSHKEVTGFILELQSFQGTVEFEIQNRKENAPFFKNKVLINGKKVDKHANLLDVLKTGMMVRLKISKTSKDQHFKIIEVEHQDKNHAANSIQGFSTPNCAFATDFSQAILHSGGASWKTTALKLPYIDGAAGTVVTILSDSTGIILTDPDDEVGGCKVSFEANNLFINGEEYKAKSLNISLHLGQSVHCTATKVNERCGIEYKAFAVWIGKRPLFGTVIACYMPKMKINNLKKGTVCHGTVTMLAPPKAAILSLDSDNYAVLFLSYLRNIKPDAFGWIGDYVQVGETLLVKISGHFQNVCLAVSEAWKINHISKMLGRSTEVSSVSTLSSCISVDKSSKIASRWIQNESSSSSGYVENDKSPGNNGMPLFGEGEAQKMKRTAFYGRTGQVVSYSSKSSGILSDYQLGYVQFCRRIVIFPVELEHMDLQEYIPVGTTVYYNSIFVEKKQIYTCTKLWIGKKDKQPGFLKSPSTVLTEGESYKAIVHELLKPHGLKVTVEAFEMKTFVFVPYRVLQLHPDGPSIGRKWPAYIKCGDTLFVSVVYNPKANEKILSWVASKAWISTSSTNIEEDAVAVKMKKQAMSTMHGKLASVSSDRGEISTAHGKTVYFSNKNAYLFDINLSQMDLQKVFIEGETIDYILPENNDGAYREASKVWYGTLDSKATFNQRLETIIDYWMTRDLDKPTLRAAIKELKRQLQSKINKTYSGDNLSCVSSQTNESGLKKETKLDVEVLKGLPAEHNQQILSKETGFHSMCSDDNLSYVSSETALRKEAKSDVEVLKIHQAEQNLQMLSKESGFNSMCSVNNLSDAFSGTDESSFEKETKCNVEELRRQQAEQNLQILLKESGFKSMCAVNNLGDMFSETGESALKKETKSNIVELRKQQVEQNIQIPLKESALGNACTDGSNISNVWSFQDVLTLKKQTTLGLHEAQRKMNARLCSGDMQDLAGEVSTVHAESDLNTLPVALNVLFKTGYDKQQSTIFTNTNREWSTLAFENKHIPVFDSLEQKLLCGLFSFLADGLINPTALQEVQVCLKPVLQKYNGNEGEALAFHLQKQIRKGFGKSPQHVSSFRDKKSSVMSLSEQEEHIETTGIDQHKLRKETYVAINQNTHKACSVTSGGFNQCLLNNESNDASETSFPYALQTHTDEMNYEIAKQKKCANKEVQTISTGDILYFKVVPDV